jgi:hypothetical protein
MMTVSSEKTRTKDDLRAESIRRLKVSKSAFDFAWVDATKSLGTTIGTNRRRDQAGERQGRFCLSGSCHSHLWHKRAESVVQAVQLIWAWGFRGEPKERSAALLWAIAE